MAAAAAKLVTPTTPKAATAPAPGAASAAEEPPPAGALALSAEDSALSNEIALVMKDWNQQLKGFQDKGMVAEMEAIKELKQQLIEARKALHGSLSEQERAEARAHISSLIEEGRRKTGADSIPRLPSGDPANESNTGLLSLYAMHVEMKKRQDAMEEAAASDSAKQSARPDKAAAMMGADRKKHLQKQMMMAAHVAAAFGSPGALSSSKGGAAGGGGSGGVDDLPSSPGQSSAIFKSSSGGGASKLLGAGAPTGAGGGGGGGGAGGGGSGASPGGGSTVGSSSGGALAPSGSGGAEGSYKGGKPLPEGNIQLMLDLKATIFTVGDPCELHISLFCHGRSEFISEEYIVSLNASGIRMDDIGRLKTIFKDISQLDFSAGLHVVCRIVRVGAMSADSSDAKKEKHGDVFRRPLGCAVFAITPQLASEYLDSGKELIPSDNLVIQQPTTDQVFTSLHEHLITKSSGNYNPLPKAKGIALGFRLFSGDLADVIAAQEPLLKGLKVTNKLGFPEVVLPGEDRNDLYITLEAGEFLQDRKSSEKNVEVSLNVIMPDGRVVPNCFAMDKLETTYRSVVYYHQNNPRFSETFKLVLTPEQIEKGQIFFTFAHCSTKAKKEAPFSFAVFKFADDKGIIHKDGAQSPTVYAFTEDLLERQIALYIEHTRDRNADPKHPKVKPRKESLSIRMRLCSTKLTQNPLLHSLLHWETVGGNMEENLKKFTYIEQFEVVKFVREIFDALFSIMSRYRKRASSTEEEISALVYNALVFTVGILVDSKFNNFKPILESYIDSHFNDPHTFFILMHCLKTYLEKKDVQAVASHIRASMKAIRYIFRFIIKSRMNLLKAEGKALVPEEDRAFKADMTTILRLINELMASSSPEWVIGAQTITLKSFAAIFDDLKETVVFSKIELANIAADFVRSVIIDSKKRQLTTEKLGLIRLMVRTDVYRDGPSRAVLHPAIVDQLAEHLLGSPEETTHSLGVLAEMFDVLQAPWAEGPPPVSAELAECLLPVLADWVEVLEGLLTDPAAKEPARAMATAVFLAFAHALPAGALRRHLASESLNSYDRSRAVEAVPRAALVLLNHSPFPASWVVMSGVLFSSVTRLLKEAAGPLLDPAGPLSVNREPEPPLALWGRFFEACFSLVGAPGLQFEDAKAGSKTRQDYLVPRYGDLRVEACGLVEALWGSLTPRARPLLVDVLVGPVAVMFTNLCPSVEASAVRLFFEMIQAEFDATGSFRSLEHTTIGALNKNEKLKQRDSRFKVVFTAALEPRFRDCGNKALMDQGLVFLKEIRQLLDLMVALEDFPDEPEFEDERTAAALKLMTYLSLTNRKDLYDTYLDNLMRMHAKLLNFVEAGFCVMLKMNQAHKAGASFHEQERLHMQAIDFFDKGKDWERAIELCRSLAARYETEVYDYQKLGKMLQRQAELFQKIADQDRFFAEYFRVGFFGQGFDPEYRNKEFIYRGSELERVGDFAGRIQRKFDKAVLLKKSEPPGEDILNSPGQHLQIMTVTPASTAPISDKMPKRVAKYIQNNNVNGFLHSRSIKKEKKAENEFKTIWVMNTTCETEHHFPGTQRRSLIVNKIEKEISPVENAINTIVAKNDQLSSIVATHEILLASGNPPSNINEFTMIVNGTIDAGVNGGVFRYKDAFFTEEFAQESPDKVPLVMQLRDAMELQLKHTERALNLHRKLCSEEMMKLQEHLEGAFAKMKKEIAEGVLTYGQKK
jgi:hypothetical protein